MSLLAVEIEAAALRARWPELPVGLFIEPLERSGLLYMVTGGVASVIYGDPRFTRDVDVVLVLGPDGPQRLARTFAGGAYYVPPEERLREEAGRAPGGHFKVIHRDTALRADVFLAGDDPLHAWAFRHRRRLPFGSLSIWFAPPEYVILRKLQYFEASGEEAFRRARAYEPD